MSIFAGVMSALTNEFSPRMLLATALVTTVPAAIVIADIYKRQKADGECHVAATVWETENHNVAAFRAVDKTHFVKQYALFRTACPNGHALVDEKLILEEVKAAYVTEKK